MLRKHLINFAEVVTERIFENLQKTRSKKKVMSLMLREYLINLTEVMIEGRSLRSCRRLEEHREVFLVISWLGTRVARVLRVNASELMVGWKGEIL
jgi:hypothetical protein